MCGAVRRTLGLSAARWPRGRPVLARFRESQGTLAREPMSYRMANFPNLRSGSRQAVTIRWWMPRSPRVRCASRRRTVSAESRAGVAAFEEVAEDGFTGLRIAAAEELPDAGDGPPRSSSFRGGIVKTCGWRVSRGGLLITC